VTLSSAAILSVYAVGYARTQEAAALNDPANTRSVDPLAAATTRSSATPSAPFTSREGGAFNRASREGVASTQGSTQGTTQNSAPGTQSTAPAPSPTVAPTATPAAAPALAQSRPSTGAFMDGTYVGAGTSRHGGIEATVVVSGGKIRSAVISQCLTRYPCSRIAPLPGQVVDRQSANVDLISGATDSSRAFIQAVTNALARAR